ncbi:MAG: hypothetical protein QGF32_06885, partial [Candidatus Thalassarchaeaceae archaeon]|nr:hypothetical protein [Candidatus Thalassarchaeaceae archaeon]
MADPITDAFSTLMGYLEEVEEIGLLAQVGVSLGLTLVFLLLTRYVLLKAAWRVVKRTEATWDNDLLDPIANRVYIFILLAGVELTMMWTIGRNDAFYTAVAPYFSGIYILLSASIISVAIKFIVPAALDRYNTNKSVTVTGGNPLVV